MKTFVIFLGLFLGSFVGVKGQQGKVTNSIDSLKTKLRENLSNKDKIACYGNIAYTLLAKGSGEYKPYFDTLNTLTKSENTEYAKGIFYWVKATLYMLQGNLDSSIILHKESEKLLLYDEVLVHKIRTNLGKALNNVGKSEEAIKYYKICINYYKKQNSKYAKNALATCLTNLGVAYKESDNYEKALACYYESLKIKEQIKDSLGLVILNLNVGTLLIQQTQFEEAKTYFTKSFEYATAIKDSIGIADYYYSMGAVLDAKKQHRQAFQMYEKSLVFYRLLNNLPNIATTLQALASAYQHNKEYEKSVSYAYEALKITKENGLKITTSEIYIELSRTMTLQKKYEAALNFIDSAFLYVKQTQSNENELFVYKNYVEIYKVSNNYKVALDYLEKYLKLSDKIYNEKSQKNINNLKISYETAQKELENQQLKTANLEQSQAQQQQFFIFAALFAVLVSAGGFLYYRNQQKTKLVLQTKETEKVQAELEAVTQDRADLSRQIHDRVLSPIKGLQIKHPEMATDVEKVYEQVQLFSHRLAAYDTELITARLYEYVAIYANSFVVKPSFTGDEALMKQIPQKIATELCIIADIAMLNAYQHAQATEVYLNFDCNSQQIMLSVSDNGIGFDKQKVEASTGRGLKNMQNRADQIKAKLEIESDQNEGLGTKIRVTLKM
jgi:two-component system, NarL family, sensor kinase